MRQYPFRMVKCHNVNVLYKYSIVLYLLVTALAKGHMSIDAMLRHEIALKRGNKGKEKGLVEGRGLVYPNLLNTTHFKVTWWYLQLLKSITI